jgi:hypothetical protein
MVGRESPTDDAQYDDRRLGHVLAGRAAGTALHVLEEPVTDRLLGRITRAFAA